MALMAIASAKGGVGKTTLSILLGAELALEGYTVALLDCDLNQHAAAFGKKMELKGLKIVPSVAEQNVLAEMRKAELECDMVIAGESLTEDRHVYRPQCGKAEQRDTCTSRQIGLRSTTCRRSVTIWQNADDEKMRPSRMSGCKDADFAKRRF